MNLSWGFQDDSKPLARNTITARNTTNLEQQITVVLRYNRDSPKQVVATVNSFLSVFPLIHVIIVSDTLLPKEVELALSNSSSFILNIPLKLDLLNLILDRNVANYITTKYIFIAPPGTVPFSQRDGFSFVKILNKYQNTIIAVPVKREVVKCLNLELNLLQWSMSYKMCKNNSYCDSVKGDHGIFMSTDTMKQIAEPFMLPFPEALYIQTTSLNFKVMVINTITLQMMDKYTQKIDFTYKNQIQRQIMYKQFKIKKVVREDGTIEWHGCTRNTQRCFPSVINSIPDYLNQRRWTPPCCLKVLRETVHHVFKILKDCNVTFWLEGGSLLGAMRMKDIIPWDYDVDIGIYLQDIDKCSWLRMVHLSKHQKNTLASIVDNDGFVWEKASPEEGDFYRVQASVHNHLHVDIFPFFSRDGIMTKKTWFSTHPQDMEFPEHYLKPLTTIEFAGIEAPAPNNVKEFLELKFGKGCVENPQYPNSKLFPFPVNVKKLVVNETF
ncbi:hypothetical protein RUM43_004659 [Polyplax serrata]|uniref:Fukutin-related protein n=1 Tax=Polyplax serrata TaxID=468196 RepID=A0AAN8SDI5_POLSC